jgi:hypothetical protein
MANGTLRTQNISQTTQGIPEGSFLASFGNDHSLSSCSMDCLGLCIHDEGFAVPMVAAFDSFHLAHTDRICCSLLRFTQATKRTGLL